MKKKVIRITESELKKIIQEASKERINEYSEKFFNMIVNKFKEEAGREVEMYVRRFENISSNLEQRDITQYSWDELKDVVDSHQNKSTKMRDYHINRDVEYAKRTLGYNPDALSRYRDELNKEYPSTWKDK